MDEQTPLLGPSFGLDPNGKAMCSFEGADPFVSLLLAHANPVAGSEGEVIKCH